MLAFGTNEEQEELKQAGLWHHDGVDIYWVLENELIFGSFAV